MAEKNARGQRQLETQRWKTYLREMRGAVRAANKAGVNGRLEPKKVKKAAEVKLDQIENEVDSAPKPNAVIEVSAEANPPATETPAPAKAKEKRKVREAGRTKAEQNNNRKKTRKQSGKKKRPTSPPKATYSDQHSLVASAGLEG